MLLIKRFWLAIFPAICFSKSIEFFVSKSGNDLNDGSINHPFQTLARAQTAARGSSKANGVIVNIREGVYSTTTSATLLSMSILDSGLSKNQEVIWRAFQNEKVTLSGGISIPYSAFVPSSQGSNIYEVNLKALGITSFGTIEYGSFGFCASASLLGLFYNGQPAILARYPNIQDIKQVAWSYLRTGTVVNNLKFDAGTAILSRLQKWKHEKDPWLHGFWAYNWADNYVKIANISGSLITIDPSTPPVFALTANARYYGVNLLSELDAPWEYYVDKSTGILYFYPPEPLTAQSDIQVSIAPFVIYAHNSFSSPLSNVGASSPAEESVITYKFSRDISNRPIKGGLIVSDVLPKSEPFFSIIDPAKSESSDLLPKIQAVLSSDNLICQYSGYCSSSSQCVAGNFCNLANYPYYTQCLPDPNSYSSSPNCAVSHQNRCDSSTICCDPGAFCDLTLAFPQCRQPRAPECLNPNGLLSTIGTPSSIPSGGLSYHRRFPSDTPTSSQPTQTPSRCPSLSPLNRKPSYRNTAAPTTFIPSLSPSLVPTKAPSRIPISPTWLPSVRPQPTRFPSLGPSLWPTQHPSTGSPTRTIYPTKKPSNCPTVTWHPTAAPSSAATVFSHIRFENLNFAYASHYLVYLESAQDVHFVNCTLTNSNGYGIYLNAANSSLTGSTVKYLGCGGVTVNGGNYNTLQPANNIIHGNSIAYFGLFSRTYTGGIIFSGVGQYFSNNNVSFAPHAAIIGLGNNNVFEFNTVQGVCQDSDDSGAWYSGRSWAKRGNVIRYNLFKDVNLNIAQGLVVPSVYLDDQLSGHYVINNTFINCSVGAFIGGGRNNIVTGNRFKNIVSRATHVDGRGVGSALCVVNGSFNVELNSYHYKQPPYSTSYPQLLNIYNDNPCLPYYNVIVGNAYCNSVFLDISLAIAALYRINVSNNFLDCDF